MALSGKTILTTRAATQAGELRAQLESLGARVIECPTIQIVPPVDWSPVDDAIRRLETYQWILVTSTNAVEQFMARVRDLGALCSIPIAVVGAATARKLAAWDLKPALVPDEFRAEGLLRALPKDLDGVRILFPRAESAREILPRELRRRGAIVDVVTVYRTIKDQSGAAGIPETLASERIDCIVFTSPSTLRYFAEALDEEAASTLANISIAVIGPVTRKEAEALGLSVHIEPARATVPDLVHAIQRYLK